MGIFDRFKKQDSPAESILIPNVGRMPFPAYRGNERYIFISYAHVDSEKVFAQIKGFNENGYNVWYDEGIAPGNEWTDEIADALEKCSLFVVFITPASAGSLNVQNEINFAIGDKKPFLAIHLEETVLQGGLKLQIATKQAILQYKMTEEEYLYKYTSAFKRLGMRRNVGYTPQAPQTPASPAGPAAESWPVTAHSNPAVGAPIGHDIITIGDFQIEHGLLKEYLGTEPNIKLPDEVEIIGRTSFGKGSRFIETVDLNRTGALLNDAFLNCPNLREIKIPRSVTTILPRAFVNCPKLTLYCYRDHLPAVFEDHFGGKEIIYLDDDSEAAKAAAFGAWVGRQKELEQKNGENS